MFKLLVICISAISISAHAITFNNSEKFCTDNSANDFETRIDTLDHVESIDDNFKYAIPALPFFSFRALDMIKSQTRLNRDGSFIWLVHFRPMRDHSQLDKKHYPKVIFSCVREKNRLECREDLSKKKYMHMIDAFNFTLRYSSNGCSSKNKAALYLDYSITINENEFEAMKDEVLRQMLGSSNNFISKYVSEIFEVEPFFKKYISNLYQSW